jgi:hypothetical protein
MGIASQSRVFVGQPARQFATVAVCGRHRGTSREVLAEFLPAAQKIFRSTKSRRHVVRPRCFGTAAFSTDHAVPNNGDETSMEAIARDLYRRLCGLEDTISGEHGDGLSRTAFIRSQYGPLYRVFQQMKDVFDPQRLMNPEKIISNDPSINRQVPAPHSASGNADGTTSRRPLLPVMQLAWNAEEATDAAVRCNGCGTCRVQLAPSANVSVHFRRRRTKNFRLAPKRISFAAACVLTSVQDLIGTTIRRRDSGKLFQLQTMPAGLSVGSQYSALVLIEARAQHVQAHGLSKTAWLLSRVHTYARMASRISFLTNRLLNNTLFRKCIQRFLGIGATSIAAIHTDSVSGISTSAAG